MTNSPWKCWWWQTHVDKIIGWTKMSPLLIFIPGCPTVLLKGLRAKGLWKPLKHFPEVKEVLREFMALSLIWMYMWSISENDPFLASFLSSLECPPVLASKPWAGSELYIVLLFSFLPHGFLALVKIHHPKLLYPQYNTWKKKLFVNLHSP